MSDEALEQEIRAKGLNAPRVTLEQLMDNIVHVEYVVHVAPGKQVMRWCVLSTRNEFAVTGDPSVAVSPENDNKEIGERIAFENARNKLWPLMGYELKTRLHDAARKYAVECSLEG